MLGALYTGITGVSAAQESLNVISNNVANVSTTAYKSETASFATIYSETVSALGGQSGNEKGTGVQVVELNACWEQGSIESTNNNTDMAISGDGFFGVSDGTTTYYTRAGSFSFDENYNLVNSSGYVVQGFVCDSSTGLPDTSASTDITIPSGYSDIQIEEDGVITGLNEATGERENLFQVALFDFPNEDGLKKLSGSMYEQTTSSGDPIVAAGSVSGDGVGTIEINSLESSNVDMATEFVDLIVAQKAFQANSRVISTSADLLDEVLNIVR